MYLPERYAAHANAHASNGAVIAVTVISTADHTGAGSSYAVTFSGLWFWREFRERGRIVAAVESLRRCEDLLRVVFPHLDKVLVERVLRVDGTVRDSARTRADSALPCPDGGVLSRR